MNSPMLAFLLIFLLATGAFAAEQNDVEFSRPGGIPLTLDLKTPSGPGLFPAAIIVHGGGFVNGNKRTYVTPLFDTLSNAGFAWFTINYRMAPDYPFPAAIDDTENAIRWVESHAAEYHIDTARIALIGESAGGYIVAYVGTHLPPDLRLAGVVDFYGPNDMVLQIQKHAPPDLSKPHHPGAMEFFSVKEMNQSALDRLRDLSPLNAIHPGMPPFLFIQGTADEQVPYEQSPKMCEAMRKIGATCEVITVKNGRHGMGSWEKHPEMAHWKPEMITWLKKTLQR